MSLQIDPSKKYIIYESYKKQLSEILEEHTQAKLLCEQFPNNIQYTRKEKQLKSKLEDSLTRIVSFEDNVL